MTRLLKTLLLAVLFVFGACQKETKLEKQAALYNHYCASCHIAPQIDELPAATWQKYVLPDMAARMGIKIHDYNPYEKMSNSEMEARMRSNVYPAQPLISKEDWDLIEDYVVSQAPDSLPAIEQPALTMNIPGFEPRPVAFDEQPGALITYLGFDKDAGKIMTGDMQGNFVSYDAKNNMASAKNLQGSPIVDHDKTAQGEMLTRIGIMNPAERPEGVLELLEDEKTLVDSMHRPVNTLVTDLNNDGNEEYIVSEFGHLTGQLTLIQKTDSTYKKRSILYQPGLMRVLDRDMNGDGKLDLIALTTQGDESITVLYQEEDLQFRAEKILRFSPVWGSSWFELVDYDGDGDQDIITAHGDNADKSIITKPYHGIRIYLNDDGRFRESYFYPMHGATRVMARDFDKDGDIDLAAVSTFPDYENNADRSFVFLQNQGDDTFKTYTFPQVQDANWFLVDAADVDNDGDEDIVLSTFSYVFVPVPEEIQERWSQHNIDIMVLKNTLNDSK